jgi:Mg2+ and Co2+ transporter CorA
MDRGHQVENCRLLRNLNTYIDEDRLMRLISQLSNEVDKIESVSGRSQRTNKMRNEIAKLEDQLSYCKNQANLRTRQFRNTNSED